MVHPQANEEEELNNVTLTCVTGNHPRNHLKISGDQDIGNYRIYLRIPGHPWKIIIIVYSPS